MKKIFLLLLILPILTILHARQSNLHLQIINFDKEVNAIGLSLLSVSVTNKGSTTDVFSSPSLIEFYAKKPDGKTWLHFSDINYYCFPQKQEIKSGETIIIGNINLNILQLICNYESEMKDLILLPQSLYIKASTESTSLPIFFMSDSVKINISPMNNLDKNAFDSIISMNWMSPKRFTGKDQLSGGTIDNESCNLILKQHSISTFADLVRINIIMCWLRPSAQDRFTQEMFSQSKQYLSEIRHTEFDYIRYWIKEIETKLAEAEKRGF
jgi:hypothetical protein